MANAICMEAAASQPWRPRENPILRVEGPIDTALDTRHKLIGLEGVSKVYQAGGRTAVAAVEDLSLNIAEGSLTLVRGPSGSGKTTLLAVIGCMMRPTSGRVTVAGADVTRLSEESLAEVRRRLFGFVFQSNHLIQRATALENVMVPGIPCREFNGNLSHRARSLLAKLGLESKTYQRVELLSGGERQRVAIARALINDPEIVIADEPTAHLDSNSTHSFVDISLELLAQGKSVIVASHDPLICGAASFTQVVELHNGRLA